MNEQTSTYIDGRHVEAVRLCHVNVTPENQQNIRNVKLQLAGFLALIDGLYCRNSSIAKTKAEEACMWAVKALTDYGRNIDVNCTDPHAEYNNDPIEMVIHADDGNGVTIEPMDIGEAILAEKKEQDDLKQAKAMDDFKRALDDHLKATGQTSAYIEPSPLNSDDKIIGRVITYNDDGSVKSDKPITKKMDADIKRDFGKFLLGGIASSSVEPKWMD